jgi:RNA 3'-terminal phosphate cyclase (ATP)
MLWSQVSHDVVLRGATHNSMAPTPEYLDHVFLPVLRSIGANVSFKAEALGIYPDGGGRVRVAVHQAGRLGKLELSQRGTLEEVVVGSVGTSRSQLDVMERVLRFVQTLGQCHRVLRRQVVGGSSTNSTVYAKFRNSLGSDMFTAFCGDDSADTGGGEHVVAEMQRYIASGAPVGPELADQLLLYMALRPPSRVVMSEVTDHLRTAVPVIEAFLPVRVSLTPRSRGDVVLEVVCR